MINSHRRALLRGASILTLSIWQSPAFADCTPDPTIAYSFTTCSGSDTDGLEVTTSGTQVLVDSGADVSPGARDAGIVVSASSTLTVNGTVSGGAKSGILVTNGSPYYGMVYDPYAGAAPSYGYYPIYGMVYPSTVASISVGTDGIVSGESAVRVAKLPGNTSSFNSVSANVYNDGILAGTAGPALVAESGTNFSTISNSATGTIGGISGAIYSFGNYGLIDGGANSAVQSSSVSNFFFNKGTIQSASNSATVDIGSGTFGNVSIGNEGRIANTGSGVAIAVNDDLYLENRVGGEIRTAGSIAIQTTGLINLTNRGTIVGSVVSTASTGNSVVDTAQGTIQGDILFGSGDDLLIGAYDFETGSFANISGLIDGGDGNDKVSISIAEDATLGALSLPANFETFQITLKDDAVVELGADLDLSHGIVIGGLGTVEINRDINSTGSAIANSYTYPSAFKLLNTGNITATLANSTDFALNLGSVAPANNSGTITAINGGGIQLTIPCCYAGPGFTNSGTILADGVGASVSGGIDNSGSIRSNNDVGVISAYSGSSSNSSGTIEGHTAGIRIDFGSFSNSGTITATDGIGVDLGYFAKFYNRSGGIVTGSVVGIGTSNYLYNVVVQNAGTINGDISLGGSGGVNYSDDVFVDNGGTVNGNILLGGGNDYFISDLSRSGANGGATGVLDGGDGYDVARYRVSADTSTSLVLPSGFEGIGYDLSNGAALTLSATGPQTLSVELAGQGRADLTADLTQTDQMLLNLAPQTLAQLTGEGTSTENDLDVVSRGTLTLTTTGYSYPPVVVVNAGTAKFENAGVINLTGTGFSNPTAIFNGKEFINSGTINLDGAVGDLYSLKILNTGSIVQAVGAHSSQGLYYVGQVDNRGTIAVDGAAVVIGYSSNPSLINSGLIESRNDIAVQGNISAIINEATGTIKGNPTAIVSDYGGSILNRGTIIGDVLMGSPYPYYGQRSVFISDGGTLTGNLSLGAGNDIFLQSADGSTGVTGTIDAGAGTDSYGRFFTSDASTAIGGALPTSFESELIEAVGANTTVTLTGSATPIVRDVLIAGDGKIVNEADISGKIQAIAEASVAGDGVGVLASFTNNAELSGGFNGTVKSFVNNGSIGSSSLVGYGVSLSGNGNSAFSNNGTIDAQDARPAVWLNTDAALDVVIVNSGLVANSLQANINFDNDAPGTAVISNIGTIRTSGNAIGQVAFSVQATRQTQPIAMTITNSGLIEGRGQGATAATVALSHANYYNNDVASITFINSGVISANDGGIQRTFYPTYPFYYVYYGPYYYGYLQRAAALDLEGYSNVIVNVINEAGGRIEATGSASVALLGGTGRLNLQNAGTILGGPGYLATSGNPFSYFTYYLPGAIQGSTEADSITNTGTITGSIDLSSGDDSIVNRGTIIGDIFLSDGDDSFTQGAGAFIGTVDGGDGVDSLTLERSGTYAAPDRLEDITYLNFERLAINSGVITTDSTINFDTIAVNGGRLIGLADSVINAPGGITVASGAIFGSAGIVNANISVAGALSPGASPGTMTINGDVTLAGTSTTIFEITPQVSDALVINGALDIVSGATISIVGSRPLTPGTTLDLITASGGTTGTFSHVNAAFGLVQQSGTGAISLLGQFTPAAPSSTPVGAAVNYTNALLTNGTASPGLIAAVPGLLTSTGFSNPAAFATITPEPYASASQIGVENGLAVSAALRTANFGAAQGGKGLFGFGQAIGAWRRLPGDSALGTARADLRSSGLLGGIGFGSDKFGLGLFIGRVDARQHLRGLGATNKADGTIFGAVANAELGKISLNASLTRDGSSGHAKRTLFDGSTASGRYRLRGWTADLNAGYRIALSKGWSITPELGFTHIESRRGDVAETGGGAFNLDVAARKTKADFVSAQLSFSGDATRTIRPWVSMGLRHQLNGKSTAATGAFVGNTAQFTVNGAARDATLATVSGGLSAKIAPSLTLFANGHSEFGADSSGESASLGMRLDF